jgi:prepilin-type N-terminal cleavage/methylation domain-containing protein
MKSAKTLHTRASQRGFTLIELLVVIAIIGVLFSLSLAGVMAIRQATMSKQAQAECVQIANAMERYRQEFGQWPKQIQDKIDKTYDDIAELKPIYTELVGSNVKARVFIEIRRDAFVNGVYVDPWSRPYVIACDEGAASDPSKPYDPSVNMVSAKCAETGATFVTNVVQKVAVFSWGRDPTSNRPKPRSW